MAYLRNEPIATDDLDVSQPKLRDNTNTADNLYGLDHYAFSNLTANAGLHKQSTYPEQLVDPTTLADQIAVYTKAVAGATELFFRREGNGVVNPLSIIRAWGFFSSGGAIGQAFNATSVRTGVGQYTVSFITPLTVNNYIVLCSSFMSSGFSVGGITGVDYPSRSVNGFNINIRSLTTSSGSDLDTCFLVLSLQ